MIAPVQMRDKRDASKTPAPVPASVPELHPGETAGQSFVIQEHHARNLHWDFRLDHDGVLVSWALPRGVPVSPTQNRLAVHVEDHPLAYGSFEGNIPVGEYGAGDVSIWDRGDYDLEKWRDDDVIVTLHGEPHAGLGGTARFALIRTSAGRGSANNWLIHRMKPRDGAGGSHTNARPTAGQMGHAPPKNTYSPMLAAAGSAADLGDDDWAFEMKWDGMRALAYVSPAEQGVRLVTRNGHDVTVSYPDLTTDLLAALATTETDAAVLDGEIVAVDPRGRPDFGLLQTRLRLTEPREVAAAAKKTPVQFMLFDLLGLEGIMAKRQDGRYSAGRRTRDWVKIKHFRTQEVVVGGWRPGKGNRSGMIGSLLLGVPTDGALRYVGRVGTGFADRDRPAASAVLVRLASRQDPGRNCHRMMYARSSITPW
ncbi:DNA polymerase ligase N-terminal domain-containing protein [Cryobacterium sp. Hh7]|uniref:DNA polymerase ligase N-terminal domain-containing protein n=1 Tax=Cryobacterium sp. Hh7 TaxID=1259159 RepID=UPI001F542EFB|nr:DNA polymerase ligase N-terminal domain-containing protein [Cryobacterium sp. Hh7]